MTDKDNPAEGETARCQEQMRLAIPYLQRFGIPPTPKNYALWFDYVRGDNAALTAEIDKLISANARFTGPLCDELFERHIRQQALIGNRELRERISNILTDLTSSLGHMDDEAGGYDRHLQQHIEEIQHCDDLQELGDLLQVLADETKHMRQSTRQLRQAFEEKSDAIDDLQRELQQVKKVATSDPLTGLPNRRALLAAMNGLTEASDPGHHALLMIDIDHFKAINDSHGHLLGDRVIRFVAEVIRNNTKGQDTPCRYGGEEYAVLLPNTPLVGAIAVAENIRAAIAAARLVRSSKEPIGKITVSVGVAALHGSEDSLELIERADRALYLAKERGRNQVIPETALT